MNRNPHTPPPDHASAPEAPPHVFNFLTHEELILCFCVVIVTMAEETADHYPLLRYATPGPETSGRTDDWTELVLRAIRYLAFEHGMKFVGIVPHRDGRITAERPITPGNTLYVSLFRAGGMPDFDILIPRAVNIAALRAPSLDTEPMRAVGAMIEEEIAYRLANTPVEQLQTIAELRAAAIAATLPVLGRAFGADLDNRRSRTEMTESAQLRRPH